MNCPNPSETQMANYKFSKASFIAMRFSMMLSDLRRSSEMSVDDWVGGMFLANLEALSKFWIPPDGFRRLLAAEGIWGPVSTLQQELATSLHEQPRSGGIFKAFSSDFARVLGTARELAGPATEARSMSKLILSPEDFLLAIVRHQELSIAVRLVDSGLNLDSLAKAVEERLVQLEE